MGISIAGAGCCLMDIIHPDVDFSSASFKAARSRKDGDGGLSPGRLVFAEDAERYTGRQFPDVLAELVGKDSIPTENVGGPSVVALIHAAQMLEEENAAVAFHGARGADPLGKRLEALLRRMPVDLRGYRVLEGRTPSTFVVSDPRWDDGRGERCFVNEIGAATHFGPDEIGDGFDSASIVALGGTALVPTLHNQLPALLAAAHDRGSLTLVNTVFDFMAERHAPDRPWPLGGGSGNPHTPEAGPGPAESYHNCDLIIMDRDEALRLSGAKNLDLAIAAFMASGVGAFAITRGSDPVIAWAGNSTAARFKPLKPTVFPVIDRATARAATNHAGFVNPAPIGDTTGCGDSFAGGVIAALAGQLSAGRDGSLDIGEAIGWGIAGGAFTLGILGGCHFEEQPGEKRMAVEAIHTKWHGSGGSWKHGS